MTLKTRPLRGARVSRSFSPPVCEDLLMVYTRATRRVVVTLLNRGDGSLVVWGEQLLVADILL
jgi:hypothetical protein